MILNKSLYVYIIMWLTVVFNLFDSNADKLWIHRDKRYLPFPMGSGNKLQIITGFGIPVDLKDDDVTFGLIMKTNYELPTNSAHFTRPEEAFGISGDKQLTRWTFYDIVRNALDRLSFDGQNCLLKSICQAAFTAFEYNGLFGEILQILFVPSTTSNDNHRRDGELSEYEKAEMVGREAADDRKCDEIFQNCSLSLMDLITTLETDVLENIVLKIV